MNKPPASIFVLSILGIILGSLGILGSVAVFFLPLIHPAAASSHTFDALHQELLYRVGMLASRIIAPLLCILLISVSAGSLKLRPWARRGMLLYACLRIITGVLDSLFLFLYVLPKMNAAVSPGTAWAFYIVIVGSAVGVILSFVLPICILYFFTRPRAKDAFSGILPPPVSNFPVQFP